ncbi:hypothetical protein TRVL_03853 [Trypanosoma vivax]|nr:hypothetical protein TRVL_03853 [Trypanosoma vivax]
MEGKTGGGGSGQALDVQRAMVRGTKGEMRYEDKKRAGPCRTGEKHSPTEAGAHGHQCRSLVPEWGRKEEKQCGRLWGRVAHRLRTVRQMNSYSHTKRRRTFGTDEWERRDGEKCARGKVGRGEGSRGEQANVYERTGEKATKEGVESIQSLFIPCGGDADGAEPEGTWAL